MDLFFPTPLPDESLYSLISRYRVSLAYSNKHISHSVFDYETVSSYRSSIGQNAHNVYKKYPEFWKNERAFIRTMTTGNLLFPFLRKSAQDRLYKALRGYTGQISPMLRPNLYFPNHDFNRLNYCPRCVADDISQYGVAYWHRSHCIWFALICWKHHCNLIEVKANKQRFELPPQLENHESEIISDDKAKISSPESLANELLAGGLPLKMSIASLYEAYNHLIGLKRELLRKEADDIQEAISQKYSQNTLNFMRVRMTFNGSGRRPWVHDVLTGQLPVHIPEHLLVIVELFGNISTMKAFL